jgi:predicted DNA binding CopG/RHH family protein
MARSTAVKAGDNLEKVRSRRADIRTWQAKGVTKREMARRLHMSDSSFRDALTRLETEEDAGPRPPVYEDISLQTHTVETQVYEGILLSNTEAVRAALNEMHTLFPVLREMVQGWPLLRSMLADWAQRQQLLQVSPAYQPYDGFYSCRLNTCLIQAIKEFAAQHRLSQSELVTMALQTYIGRHGGEAALPH